MDQPFILDNRREKGAFLIMAPFVGWLLLTIALAAPAFAQQPNLIPFTTRDGLPSSQVYHITRDTAGYIWISTDMGLVRFDGYHYTVWGIEDGLPGNDIWGTFQDEEGKIWLSTFNEVVYFREDRFYRCQKQVDNTFAIYRFFEKRGEGVYFITDESEGNLYQVEKDSVKKVTDFASEKVISVVNTDDGHTYCLTQGKGFKLFKQHGDSFSMEWTLPVQGDFRGWAEWLAPTLLFFSRDSVFVYDFADLKRYRLSEVVGQEVLLERTIRISPDKLGLKTNRGTFILDRHLNRLPSLAFISAMNPNYVVEDKNRNIWIATPDGLFLLTSKARNSTHYYFSPEQPENKCTVLKFDPQYRLWMGTMTGRLYLLDAGQIYPSFDFKRYHGGQYVRGLHFIAPDTLLAGGNFGLVLLHNPSIDFRDWRPLRSYYGNIKHIGVDKNNRIFVSSAEGLFRFNRKTTELELVSPGRIYASAFDEREDAIWLGKKNGLFRIAGDYTNAERPELILQKPVNDLSFDEEGRLWIATDGYGIYTWFNGQLDSLREYPDAVVKSIRHESRHTAWAISREGLFRISVDPDHFHLSSFQRISLASGIPTSELNDLIIGKEKIYLGGENGLTIIGLHTPAVKNESSGLHISRVLINNTDTTIQSGYVLRHDQNRIRIHYAGLSFQSLGEISYEVKLDGGSITGTWEKTNDLYKEYIGLPPGRYDFFVKAMDNYGQETKAKVIHFRIRPPFWKTWWFLLLSGSVLLAGIYSLYQYRMAQILHLQHLRNQISDDLHDDLGSALSNINILVELTRKSLPLQSPASEFLNRIEEVARSSAESMDDIVWSINPRNDTFDKILFRMRHFSNEVFEARGIDGSIEFPKDIATVRLDMEKRRKFYLFFKEAVNNLAKHSGCRKASIRITYHKKQISLTVTDDGAGFDLKGKAGAGNGLRTMREKAGELGGTLQIKTSPGRGTSVELRFPAPRNL